MTCLLLGDCEYVLPATAALYGWLTLAESVESFTVWLERTDRRFRAFVLAITEAVNCASRLKELGNVAGLTTLVWLAKGSTRSWAFSEPLAGKLFFLRVNQLTNSSSFVATVVQVK